MASVFCDLDIAVHASTQAEPFGLTIVEAQSSGVPVMVSVAGGAAEIVTPEVDALGFSPGDVAALAAQIERLIADRELAARLAKAGRENAVERFSPPRLGREISAAYERAIEPSQL